MIEHYFATTPTLPPQTASGIEYWIDQTHVYARALRPGLEVLMPVSKHEQPIKGLAQLQPSFKLTPRVPTTLLWRIWAIACGCYPQEVLCHLRLKTPQEWELVTPRQFQSQTECQPKETGIGSSTHTALIEIHSHGESGAYFSPQDNLDECGGFRVYGVMGKIKACSPELLLRVGLFGHGWTIALDQVFDPILPDEFHDRCLTSGSQYYAIQPAQL